MSATIFCFSPSLKSAACLMVFTVSPPALAERDHVRLGGLRLEQERGEIIGADWMTYAAKHLAATRDHFIGRLLLQILAEGVIGSYEEPAFPPCASTPRAVPCPKAQVS